jgi:hypothetical protein
VLVRPPSRRRHDQLGIDGGLGVTEAQLGTGDPQLLSRWSNSVVVAGIDGEDPSPEAEEHTRGGEAGEPETGDDDATAVVRRRHVCRNAA